MKYLDWLLMSKESKRKLVPQLRFPEFRNAKEWEEKRLDKIATFSKGKGISKANITQDGSQPCIRYGELYTHYNEIISEALSYTDLASEDLVLSQANDVIIPSSGETQIDIATASCVLQEGIALGGDINIIRTDTNGVFLSYYFNGAKKSDIAKLAQGIAVVHLYSSQLKKLRISLPTRSEQQKIAHCLTSIDNLITAQSQKLDALKDHKKGLMQQLFPAEGERVPVLRFPEFRGAGEWVFKPLSKICVNLDFKRVPITSKDRVKGDVPYYGASGIIDFVQDHIFDEGLLCVSEDGANLMARNYPIAFSISGKTWVNNHAHVLKFENDFTQLMVENYLNSINLEKFLTGMAQPKLNRAKLDQIPIPLPNPKEQQKVAVFLSSIDELITVHRCKLDALKAHKKGLMQQLFPITNEITI